MIQKTNNKVSFGIKYNYVVDSGFGRFERQSTERVIALYSDYFEKQGVHHEFGSDGHIYTGLDLAFYYKNIKKMSKGKLLKYVENVLGNEKFTQKMSDSQKKMYFGARYFN